MKLVELLARELYVWNPKAEYVTQNDLKNVYSFYDGRLHYLFCAGALADDYRTAKVVVGEWHDERQRMSASQPAETSTSDGSTADYYKLPEGAKQLQDLISHRDMNAQMGEIFRAAYRYGMASHSSRMRDAKKIRFYIEAEIERLEKLK